MTSCLETFDDALDEFDEVLESVRRLAADRSRLSIVITSSIFMVALVGGIMGVNAELKSRLAWFYLFRSLVFSFEIRNYSYLAMFFKGFCVC